MILSLAAIVLLSSPALYSQMTVKVDKNGLLRKIENSNEDIANPKKAEKIATWLNRGKLFVEAATEISKNIYEKMPRTQADLMLGNPREEIVTMDNVQYKKLTYPIMAVYVDELDMVRGWEFDDVVYEGALEEAIAAFDKAYELDKDKKNAEKINAGYQSIFDEYYKDGGNFYFLGQYEKSGEAFENALKLVDKPGYTGVDNEVTKSLSHDTGLTYYFGKNYPKAIEYLSKAEGLGYERDGEIYNLLYHAYRGLADGDVEILKQVDPLLYRGFIKYPGNANVIESITDLYIRTGKEPKELLPVVEEAIENDSRNLALWNALGRLYDGLGDVDKSLEAFTRMGELDPQNFSAFYNQGILSIRKADAMLEEVNAATFKTQEEYDAAKKNGPYEVYKKAVTALEKAYELNPAESSSVEYLRRVTGVIRSEPGMAEKFQKYNDLVRGMQ